MGNGLEVITLSAEICAPMFSDYGMGVDSVPFAECEIKVEEALANQNRDFCKAEGNTYAEIIYCFQQRENAKKWLGKLTGSSSCNPRLSYFFSHTLYPPREPLMNSELGHGINLFFREIKHVPNFFYNLSKNELKFTNLVFRGKVYDTAEGKSQLFYENVEDGMESGKTFSINGKKYKLKYIDPDMSFKDILKQYTTYLKYIQTKLDSNLGKMKVELKNALQADMNYSKKKEMERYLQKVKETRKKIQSINISDHTKMIKEKEMATFIAEKTVSPALRYYYGRMSELINYYYRQEVTNHDFGAEINQEIKAEKSAVDKDSYLKQWFFNAKHKVKKYKVKRYVDRKSLEKVEYKVGEKVFVLGKSYPFKPPESLDELKYGSAAFIKELKRQAVNAGAKLPKDN